MIHFLVLSISFLISIQYTHAMQDTERTIGCIPVEAELLENNGMLLQQYDPGTVQYIDLDIAYSNSFGKQHKVSNVYLPINSNHAIKSDTNFMQFSTYLKNKFGTDLLNLPDQGQATVSECSCATYRIQNIDLYYYLLVSKTLPLEQLQQKVNELVDNGIVYKNI